MLEHRRCWPVRVVCRVLRIGQSGYYRWLLRRERASVREREDRLLTVQIRVVFQQHKSRYGCRRVHQELRARGVLVNHKRITRLMRAAGLKAEGKRGFRATTNSKHSYPVAPNLLGRRFEVEASNRLWLSDITYVWTSEGWLYVAMVLDAWSRRVVGWAWSVSLEADFALRALQMALDNRAPQAGWMHHSDRGSQYACGKYQALLKQAQARVSMSRKGNCWDNAMAESFFSTLKKELMHRETFATRQQALSAIFEYIEIFYNRQRRHSRLGYQSPVEFEKNQPKHPFPILH